MKQYSNQNTSDLSFKALQLFINLRNSLHNSGLTIEQYFQRVIQTENQNQINQK